MEDDDGGGFGWGFLLGLVIGVAVGAIVASGPGREYVDGLRDRTIELTGNARRAASDPENPVRKAIQDGVSAARRRREELESEAQASTPPAPEGGAGG